MSLGIAAAFTDQEIGLGALPIDGALDRAGDIEAILVDTIREACVNETISAAQCQAAGESATVSFIKTALMTIAADEQRHATLAWKTVRWILEEHPSLHVLATKTFDEAIDQVWRTRTTRGHELAAWGVLSTASEMAVAERVMRRVVRPCAKALLEASEQVADVNV
jgi:hypothetical protein